MLRYKLTLFLPPSAHTVSRQFLSSLRMATLRAASSRLATISYPSVDRGDHRDTYQSKKDGIVNVADPYRWLEGKGPDVDSFVQSALPVLMISIL